MTLVQLLLDEPEPAVAKNRLSGLVGCAPVVVGFRKVSLIAEIHCDGEKPVAVPKTLPGKASDERPKVKVQLEESTLTLQLPKDYSDQIAAH